MTGVELELFSEEQKDLYLFFEAAKRGGLSTISRRYQKANIPGRSDYDPEKPNSWITYLDANNLYGKSFSRHSPDNLQKILDFDSLPNFQIFPFMIKC